MATVASPEPAQISTSPTTARPPAGRDADHQRNCRPVTNEHSVFIDPNGAAGRVVDGDVDAGPASVTSGRLGRARARRLLAVDPVTFQRAGDDDSAPRELGLIAEELAAADLEELIGRDADGEIVGIRYSRLAVMLLAIVRQLDERIAAVEVGPAAG